MDEIEDGELPSSPEIDDEPYKPLQRPILPVQTNRKSIEDSDENETNVDENSVPGLFNDSDDDSNDSDTNAEQIKKKRSSNMSMDVVKNSDGGGSVFREMAAKFQANVKKSQRNNVWGSILQEDALTSEMTGIGVGRTLKDVCSDRGAETYDYSLTYSESRTTSASDNVDSKKEVTDELDAELSDYWNKNNGESSRKNEAIQAGRKRSVKDRLGSRMNSRDSPDNAGDSFETMSIPPPGVPREIPELNQAVLDSLQEVMDEGEEDKSTLLGDELAAKLSEPKTQLMIGIVEMVGVEVALELFNKTKDIESKGGMMIKNGERRRTPGGVFMQLLRDLGADDQEIRVDNKNVKLFFANSNRVFQKKKAPRKKSTDFKSELDNFKKMSKLQKDKLASTSSNSNTEELKPLPDILSCITQRRLTNEQEAETEFIEPDAPPNSVERTVNSYDDDFLNTECETEDIELF